MTDLLLGAQITVVTTLGDEITGELFCYDATGSNSFVLRQPLANGNANFLWLNMNIIHEVKAHGPPLPVDEVLPAIDYKAVEKRAKLLEEMAYRNAKNLGVGVTEHAQFVFDAINKTMPCAWDKQDIVVFGVRIVSPYTPDHCTGGDDPSSLERVKKVLQGELDKVEKKGKVDQHTNNNNNNNNNNNVNVTRESSGINAVEERKCSEKEEMHIEGPIDVESAWFGVLQDASSRIDLTEEVQELAAQAGSGMVHIKKDKSWKDPAPWKQKTICVRFRSAA